MHSEYLGLWKGLIKFEIRDGLTGYYCKYIPAYMDLLLSLTQMICKTVLLCGLISIRELLRY